MLDYINKVDKVKRFLLTVIHRNRFLKKRAAIQLLQKQLKGFSVWKKVSKDVREQRDFMRVEKLKFCIRKASDVERDRMDQA